MTRRYCYRTIRRLDHLDSERVHTLNNKISEEISQPFRPRARVLQLLGDELIGSARLAVFELVKNAYDADASEVVVTLDLDPKRGPSITVVDDGEGMTLDILKDVWLVPGDDHRQRQRSSDTRTSKHRRLPLGEKGLGRFAVHKLGNQIILVTRARDSMEYVVEIDWEELIAKPFLDEAPVTIMVRHPEVFSGKETGTRIEVQQLRTEWSRGEVRRLHNQITSICSPFEEPGEFQAELLVPGRETWIDDLPDISNILDHAIWKFSFRAFNKDFEWKYEFRPVLGLGLDGRTESKSGDQLKLPSHPSDERKRKNVVADETSFDGIGPVTGEFYVYDRDREVRQRMTNIRMLERYLDDMGGIRVYRDGIRVYNYGESGDDWLGLDLRRVNVPTRRISRNIVLGAINLSLHDSTGLVEKTNREGFVENEFCEQLRSIVLGALSVLESERQIDKNSIRKSTSQPDDSVITKIEKPIQVLRQALERHGVRQKFDSYLDKIENYYDKLQETLLAAGMSGLNLALIFHEIERSVRALHQVISEGKNIESAAQQAQELMHLLDGFAVLLRKDSKKIHSGLKLVKAVRQFNTLRLRYHRIHLICPLLESNNVGFHSQFSFGLVLGALNNLVDNALYWLQVRWPSAQESSESVKRRLYINVSHDFEMGPAIVVADNGVGFQEDEPGNLVRPFFTRKPEGMGLGLFYANLAMELNNGQLVFPRPNEIELPEGFDGAVVALLFKEA